MEKRLSKISQTLTPSPIQELSHLAQRCGAINLAEGFPDFAAPAHIKNAAVSAINSDLNQYSHVQGICDLLATRMKSSHGLDIDPDTNIVICCGQTEAFAATMFASTYYCHFFLLFLCIFLPDLIDCVTVIDRGDEVLILDPAFETYETCIRLAGGVPVYVPLDPPHWALNVDRLRKSFTSRTKALVLNSPHNPTGKVFSMEELEAIAGACCEMDCFAVTDEVYEYITFDAKKHISLASLPGMQERTIITSSLSKTFSVTGWRIGWSCALANIASAIRNIHVKITDSAPAPFQEAALTALKSAPAYFESLKQDYERKRDYIVDVLASLGLQIRFKPQGSFFVFTELPETWLLSDADFVRELIKKAGVAAVPGSGFFHSACNNGEKHHNRYVRFSFCKSDATLNAAAQKLRELARSNGHLQMFELEKASDV